MDPRLGSRKRYRLLSCHADYFKFARKMIAVAGSLGVEYEWMFDSGAFTAWSKGRRVELDELVRSYRAMLEDVAKVGGKGQCWLINLDVIPGSKGRTADTTEVAKAIEDSDKNFHRLVAEFGPIVLPVYHQNEDEERLYDVVELAKYICVSPRNDMHETARKKWSAEVHDKIPGVKTHGLAVTGFEHMRDVPWWSSDSATWIMLAVYGCTMYPRNGGLSMMPISSQSGAVSERGKHYDTLTPPEQNAVKTFYGELGFPIEELRENGDSRSLVNRILLSNYAEEVVVPRRNAIPQPPPSLFDL